MYYSSGLFNDESQRNLKEKSRSRHQNFILPDLCQTTSLLFLVLVSELCVLAWELADADFVWGRFGFRSIAVQWIVLLSAAALCRLRRFLPHLSLRMGWLVSFLIVEFIGIAVLMVGSFVLESAQITPLKLLQQGLAIGIIAAMVLRFFQLQQVVIEQSQAEVSSRMDALQARIKPHFLFNSLNTIAELINSRPVEAETAVENLSSLFRANLKQTSTFCELNQELSLVKGYLQLEKWRLDDRLRVNWQESLLDGSRPVPILCLQPLVENAVVHGIATQPNGGELHISALQTPRVTTLIVENDIGTEADGHHGHGIGLDNVRHRLNVLYGARARCSVERTERRYKVTLTLPKN